MTVKWYCKNISSLRKIELKPILKENKWTNREKERRRKRNEIRIKLHEFSDDDVRKNEIEIKKTYKLLDILNWNCVVLLLWY